jgi:hypothetical protein
LENDERRAACVSHLRSLADLLDIKDAWHPFKTLLNVYVERELNSVRELISQVSTPANVTEDAWCGIWKSMQESSGPMWAGRYICGPVARYFVHLAASKDIADAFEEGRAIDQALYEKLVR